jgi:dihydrofolate reductase
MSLDGFSYDSSGTSLFPVEEMHRAGLVESLAARTGAVIMNRRSFEMADDPDWYADNYELQAPIVVLTDSPPARQPKENDRLTFQFVGDFQTALEKARALAGERDVMLIGEPELAQQALAAGSVDEFYLRIAPRILGSGTRLLDGLQTAMTFQRGDVALSDTATHLHLIKSPRKP